MRYWRIKAFNALLATVQPLARSSRMKALKVLDLKEGDRVIDLGGTVEIWEHVETPLNITIVNLPSLEQRKDVKSHHSFKFVVGDATDIQFEDNSFDVVFSNSVIEHVGGKEKEAMFAREVRRLAPRYFVQTPSPLFPLEPHTGIPFWWAMPEAMRQWLIKRWEETLPDWVEMVKGTTFISKSSLREYFPDARIGTERIVGIPKSYFAWRTG